MQIVPIEMTVLDSRQHACKSDFLWRGCAETVLKNVVRFDPSIDASRIDLSKTHTNEFVERAMKKVRIGPILGRPSRLPDLKVIPGGTVPAWFTMSGHLDRLAEAIPFDNRER